MKSIAKNIGLSWVSQLLYVACQVVRVRVLYLIFEEGSRGTWFLMASLIGFAMYLELGFTGVFTRFYARCYGLEQNENPAFLEEKKIPHFSFEVLAGNAKSLFYFLGLLSFTISFVGGEIYLHHVDTFRLFHGGVTVSWFLLSLGQSLSMIGYQYSGALQGKGYVGLDALLKTGGSILSLALLLPVLFFRGSLVYVAIVEMLRGGATLLVLLYYCKAHVPEYFSAKLLCRKSVLGALWRSSFVTSLIGFGSALLSNTDPIYVASFINVRKVPDYYNASQFLTQLFGFSMALAVSAFPALLTLFGSGNMPAYRVLYQKILKYSVLLYSFFGAYLLFSGKWILELWLGPGHFVGYPVFISILVYLFIELQNSVFNNVQFSIERYPVVWAYWIAVILRHFFSFYLIARFGLLGVVLSKLIAQILTTAWFSPYYYLKTIGAWPLNYSRMREGLQVYFPGVVFLAVAYGAHRAFDASPFGFFLRTLSYFSVASLFAYFFMEKETRENVLFRFRRFLALAPQR